METKSNVPAIRFKGFDGEWKEKKLRDVCVLLRGKHLSWSDIQSDGKYECILYGHLYTDYGMVIRNVNYLTNANSINLIRSCSGDVLIPSSDTTPTGLARATSIEKNGVILGGDINILRSKGFLVGGFLSYNINRNREKLIKLIKGTTVKHLVNSDLQNVELFISKEIDEQKKITVMFEQLDTLITQHQQKHDKLLNLKKAMLEKMFPKQGATVPEIRFNGFSGKWAEKELKAFCTYHTSLLTVGDATVVGKYKLYDANKVIGYTDKNVQNVDYITIIKDGSGVGRVRLLPKKHALLLRWGQYMPKNQTYIFFIAA